MGADIHMYVEYRNKKDAKNRETRGEKPYWYSYGDGINPGRNYAMFSVLARVRGEYKDSFDPKGKIPWDLMGYAAQADSHMYIYDEKDADKDWDDWVTLEKAKSWEKYGCKIVYNSAGNPTHVETPDFHSHSWMDSEELEKAYKIYAKRASEDWGEKVTKAPVEWRAILASMKALEDDGENEVRVVFWFDN